MDLPVQAIRYGVDTSRFRPDVDPERLRRRLRIDPADKVTLFVGRMVEEMGLHVVLAAAEGLLGSDPQRHLLVVGARGPLTRGAEELALRLPGRVHVLPDLPNDELPAAYALASVTLAPSTNARACLGLAIIEAMASGRPVVGCLVGGTPEVIQDGFTGALVPPNDEKALAEAAAAYLEDPAIARLHGARARNAAVAQFDLPVVNGRFEAMFLDLIRQDKVTEPPPR